MKKEAPISEAVESKDRKLKLVHNDKKVRKNKQRLGGKGGGLSLESFANAKTRNSHYNPSLIKKKREFYANAKYVSKYKKSLKNQVPESAPFTVERPWKGENDYAYQRNRKRETSSLSLQDIYNKKREEEERARIEREAAMQAKKEERHRAEGRRRALKEKMYKKTKSGQPVMRYRIEHLMETIQASNS